MPQPTQTTGTPDEGLLIHLAPDDVEAAQVCGVQFARALAGAPTVEFMLALGKQEQILQQALECAGFTHPIARAAAAFEVGARLEWKRIAPMAVQGSIGTA